MPSQHGSSLRGGEIKLPGQYGESGKYGRLFPTLPPLFGLETLCEAEKAIEELNKLGKSMTEEYEQSQLEEGDNHEIPAGYTYLGQFIDHDLTFDQTSLGDLIVDPVAISNFRTPRFDLDGLYGAGAIAQPYLYKREVNPNTDSEYIKFNIGQTTEVVGWDKNDPNYLKSFPNDLFRSENGFALIGDPRNDTNLILSQLHLVFQKFHNKLTEEVKNKSTLGKTIECRSKTNAEEQFEAVRKTVIWYYHWIILYDYLPRITRYSREEINALILNKENKPRIYQYDEKPFIPVEFSAAAFRFGHGMIRQFYNYNRRFPEASVRDLSVFSGLELNKSISSNWIIDWRRFFDFEDQDVRPNPSRRINTTITDISNIPNIPRTDKEFINLGAIDLKRGMTLNLPSGQKVAKFLGLKPLEPEEIREGIQDTVFENNDFDYETPLVFYILKEAQINGYKERYKTKNKNGNYLKGSSRKGGKCLGEIGSFILAEFFIGLLEADGFSFLNYDKNWKPNLPSKETGHFSMVDLLNFVDDINPIEES